MSGAIYCVPQIPGWMGTDDMLWLFETARSMRSVIEVGSWKGRSTHALLSGCAGPVYAVDHWLGSQDERAPGQVHAEAAERDVFAEFWGNVGHFPNLQVIRGESPAIAAACPEAEMVFLDAGHTYDEVLADLKAWKPKAGRLLCGHDWGWPGVQGAVLDFLGKPKLPTRGGGEIWAVYL